MQAPPNRKSAAFTRWGRLFIAAGLAGAACGFPSYRFEPEDSVSCDNGVLDGDETGLDCGGSCPECQQCDNDSMCDGRSCIDNVCVDCSSGSCKPSCSDSKRNGDEAAVDCGGSCPNKCGTDQPCREDSDCIDGVCDGVCLAATCTDTVSNGNESDVDCGRACDAQCDEGQICQVDEDCKSGVCADTTCAPQHCTNNEYDPDEGETDTDCGGDSTDCARCDVGDDCLTGTDCVELVCEDEVCSAATCDDDVANGEESDRDCGGPTDCQRCQVGQTCTTGADCTDGVCADDTCQEHDCEDSVLNGDETDVDCGGGCPACADDELCLLGTDCQSLVCEPSDADDSVKRCTPASCDDGVENGSELGLDCGGRDCDLCALGAPCSADTGCASFLCEADSCTQGLALSYACGQCGEGSVDDMISYTLTLTNLTSNDIDAGGLTFRYYMSAEATAGLGFNCEYGGSMSCGADPTLNDSGIDNLEATHYIEVTLGNTVAPIAPESSVDVFVQVTLDGPPMVQENDYSFNTEPQPGYLRIPVFREGQLIWGMVPPAN